jgi:hypothetical protein
MDSLVVGLHLPVVLMSMILLLSSAITLFLSLINNIPLLHQALASIPLG